MTTEFIFRHKFWFRENASESSNMEILDSGILDNYRVDLTGIGQSLLCGAHVIASPTACCTTLCCVLVSNHPLQLIVQFLACPPSCESYTCLLPVRDIEN